MLVVVGAYVFAPPVDIAWVRNPVFVEGFPWIAYGLMISGAYLLFCAVTGVWWAPLGYLSPAEISVATRSEIDIPEEALKSEGDGDVRKEPVDDLPVTTGRTSRPASAQFERTRLSDIYPQAVKAEFLQRMESIEAEGTLQPSIVPFLERARDSSVERVSSADTWYRWIRKNVPDQYQDAAVTAWNDATGNKSFSENVLSIGRNGLGSGNWKWVFLLENIDPSTGRKYAMRIDVSTGGRPSVR